MTIWFTIAGTSHYLGDEFLEKGMKVRLEKEPDNKVDKEAIKVMMKGLGHIGYVANSPYTVVGESWSAGRLYAWALMRRSRMMSSTFLLTFVMTNGSII